jgi:hypothetical protein
MSRVYLVVWAILLLFGGFVIRESLELSYFGIDFGPGPGFFSFWLGVLVVVLAVVEIARALRHLREPVPADFFPGRQGIRRILALVGAMVAAVLLMPTLGYSLTILGFCVLLLRVLTTQSWWVTLLVAGAGSFGTFHVFRALQVFLPVGFLGM